MLSRYRFDRILANAFIIYLFFCGLILAALSVLRNLGVFEPAVIRQIFNPLLVMVCFAVLLLTRQRTLSLFQWLLVVIFCWSAIVGIKNLILFGRVSEYLSHLFQLASAFLFFSAGLFMSISGNATKIWKYAAWFGLCGFFLALIAILPLLAGGGIGRFYLPAHALLPSVAYFSVSSWILLYGSLGLLLVSNKRGTILAAALILLFHFVASVGRKGVGNRVTGLSMLFVVVAAVSAVFVLIDQEDVESDSQIVSVTARTVNRFKDFFSEDVDIDTASAGRVQEMEAAVESLDTTAWLIGNGAGWAVQIPGREAEGGVKNIHFSPLSLTAVYGMPLAVILYLSFISIALRGFHTAMRTPDPRLTMISSLYAVGGIGASLTAYTLFIDPLFFLSLGLVSGQSHARKMLQMSNLRVA